MSKHVELMQDAVAESKRKTVPAPKSTTILFPAAESDHPAHQGPQDFDHVAQQECLKLVQRIFLGQPARREVVLAAVDRGNGCSRICVEAAGILAANTSGSICLVDGNFRNPSLYKFFGVSGNRGLADSLLEEGGARSFAEQLTPSNLWLLSAGAIASESPSLLNSDRLKLRLQELRTEFDYVLIDAPALNLYSDAISLGRIADGVIVVLEANSTRRESALKGLASLRDAGVEILGAVLNQRTFPIPTFVYRRL
jgi:protein-tyrosine kinase